jgi:N-acetylglutamate synthase-like GNAT family acetyltransferase
MPEIIIDPSPDQFHSAMILAAEHVFEEEHPRSEHVIDETKKELCDAEVAVLVEDGDVKGMVAFTILDGSSANVSAIAVTPESRGRKLGRELLDFVELEATDREADEVTLHSLNDAKPFYEQLGYVRTPGNNYVKRLN